MKTNRWQKIALVGAILVPFTLAGCATAENPKDDDSVVVKDGIEQPQPATEEEKVEIDTNIAGDELERAAAAFPDVQAVDGLSKEEVQLALLAASSYRDTTFTDGYLISGQWMEEGGSYDSISGRYSRVWSPDLQASIGGLVNDYQTEQNAASTRKLLIPFLFSDPSNITLFAEGSVPDCEVIATDQETGQPTSENCIDGQLIVHKDIEYAAGIEKGSLAVKTNFSVPVLWDDNGTPGVMTITYNTEMLMAKNPTVMPEGGYNSYYLAGIDSDIQAPQFEAR